MIDQVTPTTALERSVRISALVHDANREDLQALVELGARRAEELSGTASGPDLGAGVLRFAAAVTATFEPELPAFEIGERVSVADPDRFDDDARLRGRVADRYVNERGQWEYQVQTKGGGGMRAYLEAEIAPFND